MQNTKRLLTSILLLIIATTVFSALSLAVANTFEHDFPEAIAPQLTLQSPKANTVYTSGVPLNFTLKSGDVSAYDDKIALGLYFYSLDNGDNATTSQNVTLTGLTEGMHKLEAYYSFYALSGGGHAAGPYFATADPVTFTVGSVPSITLVSPENRTYDVTNLDLIFNIRKAGQDQALQWMAYSLDGQANTTITGNSTFLNLPSGGHSIVVYANNTEGNVGASETIDFTVATSGPIPVTVITVLVIVVAAVAGLVVFMKRKNPKQTPRS